MRVQLQAMSQDHGDASGPCSQSSCERVGMRKGITARQKDERVPRYTERKKKALKKTKT